MSRATSEDRATEAETRRVEAIYDRYASSRRRRRAWSRTNPGNRAIRRELIDLIERHAATRLRSGRVLDIGCGSGWCLAALADRGVDPRRFDGVDVLESRIVEARGRLPDSGFRVGDAAHLPFPDGGFDVVLMLTLLSSLRDAVAVQAALCEARRVLHPKGVMLAYEPRLPNPLNRNTLFISRRMMRRALGSEGEVIPLTVIPPVSRRLGRFTERLYPGLARIHALRSHRLFVITPPH